jgi:signal transduction histidine kinase
MRFVPRSLFGRLLLVLSAGLIVAQLLSATINLAERDRVLLRASGMQPAQRIADIVVLLESLNPAERERIVGILSAPPMIVTLDRVPPAEDSVTTGGAHAAMFATVLRAMLGDDRPIRVAVSDTLPDWAPGAGRGRGPGQGLGRGRGLGLGQGPGPGPGPGPGLGLGMGQDHMGAMMAGPGMHRFPPDGISFLVQVRLRDGTWASFATPVPPGSGSLPWRVLLTLAVLLAAVLLLSYVAVRWVTRPLHLLASAADELGRDINRPPLPENGPAEVSRAAHAFNTMQTRLVRFIDERTRLLTAMSHDLKTPLTRMRLRAELLEDGSLREKFEADLLEMETMVRETLEFMRGLSGREPAQLVDVMALLESLQGDNEAMGRVVTLDGRVTRPWRGAPQLLRRCLSNLVDNAVLYGQRAEISVDEAPEGLRIRVRDHGPGVPEGELEKVFEPFYRIEASRSRATGGTGLGLSIARSIAQAHGGDVRLRNHEQGGLEAILTLPWRQDAAADRA